MFLASSFLSKTPKPTSSLHNANGSFGTWTNRSFVHTTTNEDITKPITNINTYKKNWKRRLSSKTERLLQALQAEAARELRRAKGGSTPTPTTKAPPSPPPSLKSTKEEIHKKQQPKLTAEDRQKLQLPYYWRHVPPIGAEPREEQLHYLTGPVQDPPQLRVYPEEAPSLYMKYFTMNYGTRVLVLNSPQSANALTPEIVDRLKELLLKWDKNRACFSVIIEANGGNFSAGTDLLGLYTEAQKTNNMNVFADFWRKQYELNYIAATMATPFSPIINGIAVGSGASLAMAGSCTFATEKALFAVTEPDLGFFPDGGMTFNLSRIGLKGVPEFLALTGHTLHGSDVVHARLAPYFIPEAQIDFTEYALARLNSYTMERTLSAYYEVHNPLFKQDFTLRDHLGVIGQCFSKDTLPEIIAALESSTDDFAKDALRKIRARSPIALSVTLKLLRDAEQKTLEQCFETEYRVAQHFLQTGDFHEGIKARLIDKRAPKWQHARIEDVKDSEVEAFFAPLSNEKKLDLYPASNRPLRNPIFQHLQSLSLPDAKIWPWEKQVSLMNELQAPNPSQEAIADLLGITETEFLRWYRDPEEGDTETVALDMERDPSTLIEFTFDALKGQKEMWEEEIKTLEDMNEYLETLPGDGRDPNAPPPEPTAEELEREAKALKERENQIFLSSIARGDIPEKITPEQQDLLDKMLLAKWNQPKEDQIGLPDEQIAKIRKQNLDRTVVDKAMLDKEQAPDYQEKVDQKIKEILEEDEIMKKLQQKGQKWDELDNISDYRTVVEELHPELLSTPEGENYTRLRMKLKLNSPNELVEIKARGQFLYNIGKLQKNYDEHHAILDLLDETKLRNIEAEEELGLEPGEYEYYVKKMGLDNEANRYTPYKLPEGIPEGLYDNPNLEVIEKDREDPALLSREDIERLRAAGLIRPDDPVEVMTKMEKMLRKRGIDTRFEEEEEDKFPEWFQFPEPATVGTPALENALREQLNEEPSPEPDFGDQFRTKKYPMADEYAH